MVHEKELARLRKLGKSPATKPKESSSLHQSETETHDMTQMQANQAVRTRSMNFPSDVMALQRAYGNRAVSRMIQTKREESQKKSAAPTINTVQRLPSPALAFWKFLRGITTVAEIAFRVGDAVVMLPATLVDLLSNVFGNSEVKNNSRKPTWREKISFILKGSAGLRLMLAGADPDSVAKYNDGPSILGLRPFHPANLPYNFMMWFVKFFLKINKWLTKKINKLERNG